MLLAGAGPVDAKASSLTFKAARQAARPVLADQLVRHTPADHVRVYDLDECVREGRARIVCDARVIGDGGDAKQSFPCYAGLQITRLSSKAARRVRAEQDGRLPETYLDRGRRIRTVVTFFGCVVPSA